jgi:glycosyltransferase 2 family protein
LAPKANKILLVAVKLAISSSLLYFILTKTGIEQVFITLKSVSILSFIAAVALYIVAQITSTIRWKLLLPDGIGIRKVFSLYMIGAFFNTLLPGVIGGDAVKGFYLYQLTGKGSMSLASVFMDRYIGFIGLIIICTLSFPFGYKYFAGSHLEWMLPLVILSFIIASFLIFGLRLGRQMRLLSEFYVYFHAYRNRTRIILQTLGLSIILQFMGILTVYILALGMGQHIPFIAFPIFLPLIILFTMIPVSISGLGVREGAFVLFFGLIGIKPEVSTALSLLWFLTVTTVSLIGLIEYIKYRKDRKPDNSIRTCKGD